MTDDVTDKEFLAVRQTPAQLIEQAEQDLLSARLAWRKTAQLGFLSAPDVAFSEMLIHSAEAHIKLANAKRLFQPRAAEAEAPATVTKYREGGYRSQIEMLGG